MSGPEGRAQQDQLLEEAASWFARMRGPDAEHHRPEFEAWLARGAIHRGAYNRAAEIFALGKLLDQDDVYGGPAGGAPPVGAGRKRAGLAVAVAAVALAGLALVVFDKTDHDKSGPAVASSIAADGSLSVVADEARELRLADGSLVTLAAGSMLDARIDVDRRRVVLRRGKARFIVAPGSSDFTVTAGGGTITAHGTVFDVSMSRASRVTVKLLNGVIELMLPATPQTGDAVRRRLTPGQAVSYSARDAAGRPHPVDRDAAEQTEASVAAMRDVADMPLGTLIADVNRYAARPIRLASPRLAVLRISGHFRTDDSARLAAHLAALFDLRVDTSDPAAIVLRAR